MAHAAWKSSEDALQPLKEQEALGNHGEAVMRSGSSYRVGAQNVRFVGYNEPCHSWLSMVDNGR